MEQWLFYVSFLPNQQDNDESKWHTIVIKFM